MWIDRIKKFYSSKIEACRWLLNALFNDHAFIKDTLLSKPTVKESDRIVHVAWSNIFGISITTLAQTERELYFDTKAMLHQNVSSPNFGDNKYSLTIWLTEYLLEMVCIKLTLK